MLPPVGGGPPSSPDAPPDPSDESSSVSREVGRLDDPMTSVRTTRQSAVWTGPTFGGLRLKQLFEIILLKHRIAETKYFKQ